MEVSQRREVLVDACIAPLVQMLNDFGVRTVGSCCGHGGHTHGWIQFEQEGEVLELKIWPGGSISTRKETGAERPECTTQPLER